MFGYACDETPELMPRRSTTRTASSSARPMLRKDGRLPFASPDARARSPCAMSTASRTASTPWCSPPSWPDQSEPPTKMKGQLYEGCIEEIIKPVLPKAWLGHRYLISPTGRFVIGGPRATVA